MGELRSASMLDRYKAKLDTPKDPATCLICSLPVLQSFTHFAIVPNQFPYDLIALTHHMIISKRHCTEDMLTAAELDELKQIKRTYINDHYELITESVTKTSSIPQHYHLHLIVSRSDLETTKDHS